SVRWLFWSILVWSLLIYPRWFGISTALLGGETQLIDRCLCKFSRRKGIYFPISYISPSQACLIGRGEERHIQTMAVRIDRSDGRFPDDFHNPPQVTIARIKEAKRHLLVLEI